jgi:hypothetical protein
MPAPKPATAKVAWSKSRRLSVAQVLLFLRPPILGYIAKSFEPVQGKAKFCHNLGVDTLQL